jgi:hypothetical protein
MKFVVFVEGYTENKAIAAFLKRWLDPRLKQPVGIQTVRFNGWPEMIKDLPRKAPLYLQSPQAGQIVAVIALLDLYGPTIYPDHLETATDRLQWATADLEKKVGRQDRFRMFFAVHETEAWLLSNPNLFPRQVAAHFPAQAQRPETVNFETPPAALLNNLYQQHLRRGYRKVVDGQNLFQQLDPEVVYQKCPHFQRMMDELLRLAQEAGE